MKTKCCKKYKKKGVYCKDCPKLEEKIEIKKKKKPLITKKKRIEKVSEDDRKMLKLKTTAYLYRTNKRYTKERKFKWVVIFTNYQPSIRGEIPAVYLRRSFKSGRSNTLWGPVKREILTEGERLNITDLPELHIKFLLREMEFIKSK